MSMNKMYPPGGYASPWMTDTTVIDGIALTPSEVKQARDVYMSYGRDGYENFLRQCVAARRYGMPGPVMPGEMPAEPAPKKKSKKKSKKPQERTISEEKEFQAKVGELLAPVLNAKEKPLGVAERVKHEMEVGMTLDEWREAKTPKREPSAPEPDPFLPPMLLCPVCADPRCPWTIR